MKATTRTVVFDNEAVQALVDVAHPKHRRVLAAVEATAVRNLRRVGTVHLVVPTAVRVEAGWDRRAGHSVAINRLRAADSSLDRDAADQAADIVTALGVSVADAHLGSVLATTPGPHSVLTSDEADVRRISGHTGIPVTVVVV